MSWNKGMRQVHRWMSMAFTAVVAAIFALLGTGNEPSQAIYLLPLIPLAILWLTGLYMFVLLYAARRRDRGPA
jgi:ABC-type polysaccharide/polyol phosphate export permease